MQLPDDILLVDKPAGITSFDVIRRLRKELGIRKLGHAGTLDPLATGLMIIGVGTGTKKLNDYLKLDKEYLATIRLGERRSTGDLEGEVLETRAVINPPEHETVRTAVVGMVGTLTLPVSAYSAIKKDGVPMYKRARAAAKRGEHVKDVPVRDMQVLEAEVLQTAYDPGTKRLDIVARFHVGSGTYIRSLAEELGRRLGHPATLALLRRTKIGEFVVEDARDLNT